MACISVDTEAFLSWGCINNIVITCQVTAQNNITSNNEMLRLYAQSLNPHSFHPCKT